MTQVIRKFFRVFCRDFLLEPFGSFDRLSGRTNSLSHEAPIWEETYMQVF